MVPTSSSVKFFSRLSLLSLLSLSTSSSGHWMCSENNMYNQNLQGMLRWKLYQLQDETNKLTNLLNTVPLLETSPSFGAPPVGQMHYFKVQNNYCRWMSVKKLWKMFKMKFYPYSLNINMWNRFSSQIPQSFSVVLLLAAVSFSVPPWLFVL